MIEGYGQTETSGLISLRTIEDTRDSNIGNPVSSYYWKIIPTKNENKKHTIGELCLKGKNLMKGYLLENNRFDRKRDEDDWYHTGDIVEIKDNGK